MKHTHTWKEGEDKKVYCMLCKLDYETYEQRKRKNTNRKIPQIITKEEYNKLIDYIKKERPCNFQHYLLCCTLGFEAGLRISEIVGYKDKVPVLTKERFDFEKHSITIKSGKGSKDRIVPLPEVIKPNHILILPIKMERRAIQSFIAKTSQKVLGKKIHFHTLRHGFATHLINSGMPITMVQNLMGHSNIATTSIYTHTNPQEAIKKARELF